MADKICFINCSSFGSTGNIIFNLSSYNRDLFNYCYILGDKGNLGDHKHSLFIGYNKILYKFARLETFLFGNDGFLSFFYKRKISKFLKKEKPTLIHIHNPHRSFCNIDVVFDYCIKNNVKVVWTTHDSWALTGRCCTPLKCEKWKDGCVYCDHKNYFPKTIRNSSSKFYLKKRAIFKTIGHNLVFVSPSNWMAENLKYLNNNNEVIVINNGINTDVFKQTAALKFIDQIKNNRFVVGGAALYFNELKGRSTFEKLADKLGSNYLVVLIGGDNKNVVYIKDNLVIIPKTHSQEYMSQFYNSLDVFVNPTQTDNFPTTHLESIACGTPVITYQVGGAGEMIEEGINGFSVPLNDIDAIINKIIYINSNKKMFDRKKISATFKYPLSKFCGEYRTLYERLLGK